MENESRLRCLLGKGKVKDDEQDERLEKLEKSQEEVIQEADNNTVVFDARLKVIEEILYDRKDKADPCRYTREG